MWEMEPKDTSVLYQNSVALHCQASGFPHPTINWLRSRGRQKSFHSACDRSTGNCMMRLSVKARCSRRFQRGSLFRAARAPAVSRVPPPARQACSAGCIKQHAERDLDSLFSSTMYCTNVRYNRKLLTMSAQVPRSAVGSRLCAKNYYK